MEIWHLDDLDVEPRKPQVLHSDDDATRLIVLSLPAGEQMGDHQVREHALLLVIDGELELTTGTETTALRKSDLVYFAPAERRRLVASTDARIGVLLSPWPAQGSPSRRADVAAV